jgi:hypothetical protein
MLRVGPHISLSFSLEDFYNAPASSLGNWQGGGSMAGFTFRKYQRFKESVPVRYHGHGSAGEGLLIDLSLNGGRIKGKMPVSEGMVVEVNIPLPGDPEPLIIEQASVQWVRGLEFGIEFKPQRVVAERIIVLIAELANKRHSSSH